MRAGFVVVRVTVLRRRFEDELHSRVPAPTASNRVDRVLGDSGSGLAFGLQGLTKDRRNDVL